jgi:hypothetical protein
MSRHTAIAIAAVAATAVSVPSAAFAHAHLLRAVPAAGSTVTEAPAEVVLSFSEKVEPAFSSAVVRDAGGKALDNIRASVDKADPTVVRVSLPRLGAGAYTVEWRVMSADTHKVSGSFRFRVGE